MTQQHFSFPSIEQFRSVVKYVNDRCSYALVPKPTLLFHGTVKLHGTNSSVVYSNGEVYAQSRTTILTTDADNAGFANWVQANREAFATALAAIYGNHGAQAHSVAIYGEWCGKGIQKGVAISELPKMFVVFAICLLADGMVKENGEMVPGTLRTWLSPTEVQSLTTTWLRPLVPDVYSIEDFPTFDVEIDFNNPAQIQNHLGELTLGVEKECPVGAAFGVKGVGEGIVWVCVGSKGDTTIQTDDLIFKVKGEKHSDSKVKTLAAVDIEKINSIRECAEQVATPHRFEKGMAFLQEQHPNEDVKDNRYIGEFLKWVGTDVIKEERDTIVGNGLDPKDVMKAVNNIAKNWFLIEARVQ